MLRPSRGEREDDVGVGVGLVQLEASELEKLDFHGVAYEFVGLFDFDDGVVAGHVGKNALKVPFLAYYVLQVKVAVRPVLDSLAESRFICRYNGLKVHEILCKRPCFIEAAKADIASCDNLVFFNTKDTLLFQFVN